MTDDDFSDLVEACNSPAAKRIEQLERELAETREQRDRLVEALQACMRWSDCTDIPNEVQRMCHQALAAVKGGMP
jgi:hypothetical protein